jgi:TonB family protein
VAEQSEVATFASPLAAYLDRIRRAVSARWHPSAVYTRADLLEAKDRSVNGRTELVVRLHADGALDDASVLVRSGNGALDNEAVAAFARTEPFAPVPTTLVDARGGFSFRFAFNLDLERARYLRTVTELLRRAWLTPGSRAFLNAKPRLAVVRVAVRNDGTLVETALEIASDVADVNRSALDLVARVGRFPPPPDSLRVTDGRAQFRASLVLRPFGSDELRVFARPSAASRRDAR